MSRYLLVITSDVVAPVNMPKFIKNLEDKYLTSFEVIGELYKHKALYIKPKASQLGLLRTVASTSSIDMVFYAPMSEGISTAFTAEMSGLPRLETIADIEAQYDEEKSGENSGGDEGLDLEADESDEDENGGEGSADMFAQGGE